jgi:hypothetical protein
MPHFLKMVSAFAQDCGGQGGEILQFANTPKPTLRLFSCEKKFFSSPRTNDPYREQRNFFTDTIYSPKIIYPFYHK